MKRWLFLFGILAATTSGILLLLSSSPERQYSRIGLGMTEAEITTIMEKEADERTEDEIGAACFSGKSFSVVKQCWWHPRGTTIGVSFDENGRAVHKFIDTPFGRKGEPTTWLN